MYKFASLKEHLFYFITGTETPQFLTEREKVMMDKFLEFYNTVKQGVIETVSKEPTGMVGLKFEDLKEDTVYSKYSKQFNISNRVRLIGFDRTPLNRDIAYFQYVDRGHPKITKSEFLNETDEKPIPVEYFAIWGFELESGSIVLTPSN